RHLFALFALLALVVPFNLAQPAMAAGPTVTPGVAGFTESLIGARARAFASPSQRELFLGVPDLGNNTPQSRSERDLTWAAGNNTFTFTYDSSGPSLTATVVNSTGTFPLTVDAAAISNYLTARGKTHPLSDLNLLQLIVKNPTPTSPPPISTPASITFNSVVLDGTPLGNFGGVGFNEWTVSGAQLADGFTITGVIALTAGPTSAENPVVEINVGYAAPTVGISASDTTICVGAPTTINVNFANVSNLYGYELKVNYPTTGFTATGKFDNTWFDAAGTRVDGWDGTPSGGVVKFAASKVAADPVSGSGIVATVTLTATTAGTYPITLSDVLLGDRDGNQITATAAPTTVTVTVCGFATVTGKVNLQGRGTGLTGTIPPTGGTVTLLDAGYGQRSTSFDATGNFTITNVMVAPGGTTYTISATHNLYLSNITTTLLMPLANVTLPTTRLKGGDANNSGKVEVDDLSCIGGSFGGSPVVCGVNGSSDINADGVVNILDLVLPGGNFDLIAPQPW
ncbi:MAG: hypothetical protein WCG26_13395, partial [Chloroflexales bacterium]